MFQHTGRMGSAHQHTLTSTELTRYESIHGVRFPANMANRCDRHERHDGRRGQGYIKVT